MPAVQQRKEADVALVIVLPQGAVDCSATCAEVGAVFVALVGGCLQGASWLGALNQEVTHKSVLNPQVRPTRPAVPRGYKATAVGQ